MKSLNKYIYVLAMVVALFAASCSTDRMVGEGDFLLDKVEVKCTDKSVDASTLAQYVRQQPNSRWFSLFKIPLGVYSLSGQDSTRWLNRTLRRMGEEPVLYDRHTAELTCNDLQDALKNMGYVNASVSIAEKPRGKRMTVRYDLHPGTPYFIRSMSYDVPDAGVAALLADTMQRKKALGEGHVFTAGKLDQERKRITQLLLQEGFYKFNKDFIHYTADTVAGSKMIDVTLHVLPYRVSNNSPETSHPRYSVGNVSFTSGDRDSVIHLRPSVMAENNQIRSGEWYDATKLRNTYNNFGRLQAVRYTGIHFTERPDTTVLDCNIQVSTNEPNTISFQPEGTNTAGDLGAAASLTYQNRNLFRGSELLSVQVRGAFEAITELDGYGNEDYEEYGLDAKLEFPRLLVPFAPKRSRNVMNASSQLALRYDMQNRPEFNRRVFTVGWRYRWSNPRRHLTYKFDVLDINYIYMPWISETFKHDYLDDNTSRNAILKYNYEDLFITKMGFGVAFNDGIDAVKLNVETSGNVLALATNTFNSQRNSSGQRSLFNIAFAQYAKFDIDYTHLFRFDRTNSLALHAALGVAYPYGNSTVLPFEKRYFSGGANSVRGWGVRTLGPGCYRGKSGRIDFINQTGDMKLDFSAEYRTHLFWKFDGALFVDAGNIWTLREYAEQPGGQFLWDEFYKQIAVAYGLGVRLNFSYFILRFDMGMKALNPAYESEHEHYALLHPNLSRDFSFHFAVGMPF